MKKNKLYYIVSFISSYLFTLMINLSLRMTNFSTRNIRESFNTKFHFSFKFFIITLLISIPIYLVLNLFVMLFAKIKIQKNNKLWNIKKIRIIIFLCVLLTGLLFLITYYPGVNLEDTLYALDDPLGTASQFPRIYCLLISAIYKLFLAISKSMNISFFLLSFFQLVIMSLIITHLIVWFYKKFKNKGATIILIVYFSCVTIITNYNVALLRDPLFAVFFLLLIPYLYEIIETKGMALDDDKNIIIIVLIMGSICLLRSNGIYVCVFLILVLLFKFRKFFKNILFLLVGVILLANIAYFLPKSYRPHIVFQEKAGILIQQVAYTLKYSDLDYSDKKELNEIMNVKLWEKNYNHFNVDYIKHNQYFDRELFDKKKNTFIKIWLKYLPNHFEDYTKAYLYATYDLWSIQKFNNVQSRFLSLDDSDPIILTRFINLKKQNLFPQKFQSFLEQFYNTTIIYINGAACFWIMIFLILVMLYKKDKKIMLFLPLIGVWLTLVLSTPIASAFRYMCIFAYYLPFMLTFTLYFDNNKKKNC